MMRSYVPTQKLIELQQREPELAAAIEELCQTIRAMRGPCLILEMDAMLSYSARSLEPWIVMQDAFDLAMIKKVEAAQKERVKRNRAAPEPTQDTLGMSA